LETLSAQSIPSCEKAATTKSGYIDKVPLCSFPELHERLGTVFATDLWVLSLFFLEWSHLLHRAAFALL
jgi:hypothetical protein